MCHKTYACVSKNLKRYVKNQIILNEPNKFLNTHTRTQIHVYAATGTVSLFNDDTGSVNTKNIFTFALLLAEYSHTFVYEAD